MAESARTAAGKDVGIQALRGIAVVLMVAGHVIGGDADGAIAVSDDSGWRFSYLALEDVRMPLFTVLSGYVYALRPVPARGELGQLLRGKARRLLVPLVVVGTVLFAVKLVAPGVHRRPEPGDLPKVYFFGFEHLWFLQAIFLIFLVVGALDAFGVLGTLRGLATVLVASFLSFYLTAVVELPFDSNTFSLGGALRLLPFFLLGVAARRYSPELVRPRALIIAVTALVPLYGLRLWEIAADVEWHPVLERSLSLTVGVLSVVTLLAIRRHLALPLLTWLGGFSFGIYLLHVFATSGTLVLMGRLGVTTTWLEFCLGLAAGLGFPVVFELVLGRRPFISWAVLGQRPRRRGGALVPVETRSLTSDAVT